MTRINVDFSQKVGSIKKMNAVNNGPLPVVEERAVSNFEAFQKLHIPYARTHDASFCAAYGGEHSVDVNFIFPYFFADETDPKSYDFQLTDEYLQTMIAAGTEPFFRLGSKIEHWSKKYNTKKPEDFDKWARICEHIIAHYTEGWANGYNWNITYWEIWNEADGRPDDAPPEKKECWGGTMAEYFDFYVTVAKHLKARFPHLKIGGPACCSVAEAWRGFRLVAKPWVVGFLQSVRDSGAPLDFFSWHGYLNRTEDFTLAAKIARETLDRYGFTSTESILNEWNFLYNWSGDAFLETIKAISGIRGALFNAAMMIDCQNAPVDMLMYYDARPTVFNGMFDFYTQQPLKGYYPFFAFNRLAELGAQVKASCKCRHIRVLAAEGNDKKGIMIAYYPSTRVSYFIRKRNFRDRKIVLPFPEEPKVYLLDENHDLTETTDYVYDGKTLTVTIKQLSMLYIETK